MTKTLDDVFAMHHFVWAGSIPLRYTHPFFSSLASAHQSATARARAKAQHSLGPPFSLPNIIFCAAVGVQAFLDPALYKAPERRHQQIIQGRQEEQFKDAECR